MMFEKKQNNYLTGKILIAIPSMGDPRFHRALILVCAHDENGAMGLVINHAMPGLTFDHFLDQLKLTQDIKIDINALPIPVVCGGPVDGSRGFLLHSSDFKREETIRIDDHFSVTGTIDALQNILEGKGPEKTLFILGYAGWSEGQLEEELRNNSWLVVEPDTELIFHDNQDQKWSMAVKKLGIDPGMLSATSGRA